MFRHVALLAAAVFAPDIASAQDSVPRPAPPPPTVGPPIRRIASASALSSEQLGAINSVLELRDGRVLVNDGVRRRLLLMDTTLSKVEIVLDSLSEIANTYGTRPGTLIPYRGDSVLFIDPVSYAMIVFDPTGKMVRVRSVWRVEDTYMFAASPGFYGWPATDAKGRVVYRTPARPAPPKVAPPPGVPYFPPEPDSAFIVAMDIDSRKLDTLGAIRIPKSMMQIKQTAEGSFTMTQTVNPLPMTDDWAVLPDGVIAFIRGRDYRIDYRHPDGTWTSSPKIPFAWQHLTEGDKQKLVDSVKSASRRSQMSNYVASMIRWSNQFGRPYPSDFKVPEGYVPPPGFMKDWKLPPELKLPANYIYGCPPGVEPTMSAPPASATAPGAAPSPVSGAAPAAAPVLPPGMAGPPGAPAGIPSCIPSPIMITGGMIPPPPTIREVGVLPADELPDYRPPFSTASVRADADGNLWIRTIPPKPIPGGNVYDIVNRAGELVDRLQIPPGYTVVGFGKDKVVYLSMRDQKGIHLARVRLR